METAENIPENSAENGDDVAENADQSGYEGGDANAEAQAADIDGMFADGGAAGCAAFWLDVRGR